MKRIVTIIFLLSFQVTSFAQIKLPSKEAETKPPVKQTTTVKSTETKSVSTGPVLVLKVTTDTDCNFYVDGEYRGFVATDDVLKINLNKGDYQLKAVATNNSEKVIKQLYPVETTGIEKFYNIEFNKTNTITTTQSNGVVKTNTSTEYGKDAQVTITWLGPGSVKLYFDKEEFFFTEGEEKTLDLKSDHAYFLKAIKPEKNFNHSEFLAFVKGEQYFNLAISNNSILSITKGLSPEEKRSKQIIDAQNKIDYDRYLSEAKNNPCYDPKPKFLENWKKKGKEMITSCQKCNELLYKARQFAPDEEEHRYINEYINSNKKTILLIEGYYMSSKIF